MYGGGIYASAETCRWKFVGATYGDSSNDMKWDNAAAHLRLTESTSGEPGYIYMLEDKSNGIGTYAYGLPDTKMIKVMVPSVYTYPMTKEKLGKPFKPVFQSKKS